MTRLCVSAAVNRNQARRVVLCLASQFWRKWVHEGVSDSMMSSLRLREREKQTDRREDREEADKNIKRFNSLLTSELAMRGSRKQNGLSCITILH